MERSFINRPNKKNKKNKIKRITTDENLLSKVLKILLSSLINFDSFIIYKINQRP